jgi:hypothetical protein
MPQDSERRESDADRVDAVKQLKGLASAFLHNPFNPTVICEWYIGFGEHCPLWALQEVVYPEAG